MSSLNIKLSELDKLETELIDAMQLASKCTSELVKEKIAHKVAENQVQEFLKKIRNVENGILQHINYLSQIGIGMPHEGSAYMATIERQSAADRLNYMHEKLIEAEKRSKEKELVETSFNNDEEISVDDDDEMNYMS